MRQSRTEVAVAVVPCRVTGCDTGARTAVGRGRGPGARARRGAPDVFVLGAVLVLGGGCADAHSAVGFRHGVARAASGAAAVASAAGNGEQAVWRVVERVRIGRLEGEGPEVFGRIGAVQLDGEGRVYVMDNHARELRVFDDRGAHVATIGRRGAGPQEFEYVAGLAWAPDGALWLVDAGNGRYTRLGPDGKLETVRRPVAVYHLPWLGGWDEEGSFYDQAVTADADARSVLVKMAPPGVPVDTLILPTAKLAMPRFGSMSFPLPFAPRQLFAFDRSGRIWVALSSEYRLTALDLKGDTLLVVQRPREPDRLTAAQRDSIRKYVAQLKGRFGVEVRSEMIPERAPILKWMVADDAGRLWVCATGLSPCETLDVIGKDGRPLAVVRLPAAAEGRPAVRGTRIAYAAEGPQGEPIVLVGEVVTGAQR